MIVVGEGAPVRGVPLGAQPGGLLVPGDVDQAVAGGLGLVAALAVAVGLAGQFGEAGLDPGQLGLGGGLRGGVGREARVGGALRGGLLDQGGDPAVRGAGLLADGAGEGVRLVQDADRRVGRHQLLHDVLAGEHDRGVAGVAVPALPGGGVEHGRDPSLRHALPGLDRRQLRAADLDDVVVADADVGYGVAVAARAACRPHLVVDLAVRVHAGQLVAVSVADEDVPHGGDAQQVDVLADVRRVQGDAHVGQVQVHQVHATGHADDGDRGGGQVDQDDPLTQDDQRLGVQLLHGLQPHVDLVGGVLGAGEVQHRLGAVLGQPVVDGGQDLLRLRRGLRAADVGNERQHVQAAHAHRDADADETGHGRLQGRRDEDAGDGRQVEVQHLLRGAVQQPARRGVRDADTRGEVDVAGGDRHTAAVADQGDQRAMRGLKAVEGYEAGDRAVVDQVVREAQTGQQQDQQELSDQETDRQTCPHLAQAVDQIAALAVQIVVRQVRHGGRGREGGDARDERGQHECREAQHHEGRRGQLGRAAHPGDANSGGYHGKPAQGEGPV